LAAPWFSCFSTGLYFLLFPVCVAGPSTDLQGRRPRKWVKGDDGTSGQPIRVSLTPPSGHNTSQFCVPLANDNAPPALAPTSLVCDSEPPLLTSRLCIGSVLLWCWVLCSLHSLWHALPLVASTTLLYPQCLPSYGQRPLQQLTTGVRNIVSRQHSAKSPNEEFYDVDETPEIYKKEDLRVALVPLAAPMQARTVSGVC
jgi:hypothetical protein